MTGCSTRRGAASPVAPLPPSRMPSRCVPLPSCAGPCRGPGGQRRRARSRRRRWYARGEGRGSCWTGVLSCAAAGRCVTPPAWPLRWPRGWRRPPGTRHAPRGWRRPLWAWRTGTAGTPPRGARLSASCERAAVREWCCREGRVMSTGQEREQVVHAERAAARQRVQAAHDQDAATRVAQRAEQQRRADEYARAHRAAASSRAADADGAVAADHARPV